MKAKPHLEQTGCESSPKSKHTFVLHSLPEAVSHASEMDINSSIVGKPRTLGLSRDTQRGLEQAEKTQVIHYFLHPAI